MCGFAMLLRSKILLCFLLLHVTAPGEGKKLKKLEIITEVRRSQVKYPLNKLASLGSCFSISFFAV